MICRFCGMKTDSAAKCPHCSHDAPVTLIYRSYSNNTIVDKLRSVLQPRPQEDKDDSAPSVPVILDAEAALQKLKSDSSNPVENDHESDSIDKKDETSKECAPELDNTQDDKQPPDNQVESIESENPKDQSNPLPEQQSDSEKGGSQLSNDNNSKNPSADVLTIRIKKALKSHLRLTLIGTAVIALVFGFVLGYVARKTQDKESLHNNPEKSTETTVSSPKEDVFTTSTSDSTDDATTKNVTTYTRKKDDESTTISDTETTKIDDIVREGVLREKESEEIQ